MLAIYLSAPVFTQMQRQWNRQLAQAVEHAIPDARVVLPQDFTFEGRYNDPRNFPDIFRQCLTAIEAADLVVAVLDGPDVDSGVALEVGYAHARGKRILGVRTDFRQSQDRGVNLMLSNACTSLLREMSFGESMDQLARDLVGKVLSVMRSHARSTS